MKLGTGPSTGVSREGREPGKGNGHRHHCPRTPAVAAQQAGSVGGRDRPSTSSRHPLAPSRGQLPGRGESGGVGCRFRLGHSHGGGGEAPQAESQRTGQSGDGAEQHHGRTPLGRSQGPHRSTRMTARAESWGSGSSGPTTGTAVGLR